MVGLVLALGVIAAACGSTTISGEAVVTERVDGVMCDGAVGVMLPYTGTSSTDLVQILSFAGRAPATTPITFRYERIGAPNDAPITVTFTVTAYAEAL